MSSFRKYGGVGLSGTHAATRTRLTTTDYMNIARQQGQQNTATFSGSHHDMGGNAIMTLGSLSFVDGSVQYTAAIPPAVTWTTATDGALVNINPSSNIHVIGRMGVGADLEFVSDRGSTATIHSSSDLCIAALGDVSVPGSLIGQRLLVAIDPAQMVGAAPMITIPRCSVDELVPISFQVENTPRFGLDIRTLTGGSLPLELVKPVAGGREAVDYMGVVALLVREVQRLKLRVELLEKEEHPEKMNTQPN